MGCRDSIAFTLCIVGSRLTRHLVGRARRLVGRTLHLVVVEALIWLLSLVVVSLILLLPLVTSLKGRVTLGTLLVVVVRTTTTSLLLRRVEFPLLLLHLMTLVL
jgi:hypothetical protein